MFTVGGFLGSVFMFSPCSCYCEYLSWRFPGRSFALVFCTESRFLALRVGEFSSLHEFKAFCPDLFTVLVSTSSIEHLIVSCQGKSVMYVLDPERGFLYYNGEAFYYSALSSWLVCS